MEEFEKTVEQLKIRLSDDSVKTVIIPHISPDGDAVGSCSALSETLCRCGIECRILYSGIPAFFETYSGCYILSGQTGSV